MLMSAICWKLHWLGVPKCDARIHFPQPEIKRRKKARIVTYILKQAAHIIFRHKGLRRPTQVALGPGIGAESSFAFLFLSLQWSPVARDTIIIGRTKLIDSNTVGGEVIETSLFSLGNITFHCRHGIFFCFITGSWERLDKRYALILSIQAPSYLPEL